MLEPSLHINRVRQEGGLSDLCGKGPIGNSAELMISDEFSSDLVAVF